MILGTSTRSKRKQQAPKRRLGGAVPVVFKNRKMLVAKGGASDAPPPPPPRKNSKFFFDMLMSIDSLVVGEYIIPRLPNLSTLEGQNLLSAIVRASEEGAAGLMGRDLLWGFWVPSCREAPDAWVREPIPFKAIVSMTAFHRGVHGLIKSVSEGSIAKAIMGIGGDPMRTCIDLSVGQCTMCAMPCSGGSRVDNECYHRHSNPGGWSCLLAAQVVSSFLREYPIPIHTMRVRGMDLATPRGGAILECMADMMRHRRSLFGEGAFGPLSISLSKFSMVEGNIDGLCTFIRSCMGDCESVDIGEFRVVESSRRRRTGGRGDMGPILCTPASVFYAIQEGEAGMGPCKVRNLSISAPCVPADTMGLDAMVMSMLRMPSLQSLSFTPCTWGEEDTTSLVFDAMKRCMDRASPMRFHELRSISISIVDDLNQSRITTTTGVDGTQYISMDANLVRQVEACALSCSRFPSLRRIEVHCGDSPICSLKLMTFLSSLKNHRGWLEGTTPPKCMGGDTDAWRGEPLDIIEVFCKYVPKKITENDSAFMRGFKEVAREIRVNYSQSYVPGAALDLDEGW